MYVVRYPPLAITVGLVQIVNAFWGALRQFKVVDPRDGGMFATSIWFGWLLQLALQIMAQSMSLPGKTLAAFPPTVTAFAFGVNFMPAYLDSKANQIPEKISPEYYGLPAAKEGGGDDKDCQVDEEASKHSM